MVQAFDEGRRQLFELQGIVLTFVRAGEQAADASRSGVLPEARSFRPRAEDRNANTGAEELASQALSEDGERRVAGVIRHRHRITLKEAAVRHHVDDVTGAACCHMWYERHR